MRIGHVNAHKPPENVLPGADNVDVNEDCACQCAKSVRKRDFWNRKRRRQRGLSMKMRKNVQKTRFMGQKTSTSMRDGHVNAQKPREHAMSGTENVDVNEDWA